MDEMEPNPQDMSLCVRGAYQTILESVPACTPEQRREIAQALDTMENELSEALY